MKAPVWTIALLLILIGCSALPQRPTPTPTRHLSAPTIVPSPTVQILSSDQIYNVESFDGQNNLTAAALPNEGGLPPFIVQTQESGNAQPAQIVLETGQIVLADLYEHRSTENRVPGILLIGTDRLSWGILPEELQRSGFTVLVVEPPQRVRIEDIDTLLQSLSENGTVDPGKLALIGADPAADTALLACATLDLCDRAVLLSPRGQDTLLNVLPNYLPRPLFVSAGQNDPESYETAQALAGFYPEGTEFVPLAAGQGTGLIALNSDLSRLIALWMQQTFAE